jgi:hypothetical protein
MSFQPEEQAFEEQPPSDTAPQNYSKGLPTANLSEKEEAAIIVARAMADKEQRDKDAKKVQGGMSKEELQALINAKMAVRTLLVESLLLFVLRAHSNSRIYSLHPLIQASKR